MHEMSFLQDLMVLFGMGVVMVVAFHRLNLPPVLGFLITGVVCGPYGFKLVESIDAVGTLAEIGLVLLLFEAGIEFSVKTFIRLKKFLLVAGGLQLLLTIAATAAIAAYTGIDLQKSIFLGMLVSLSSTAIVIRILDYRGDLDSAHGRSAMSILIFQDLCIVPLVLLTPYLSGKGGSLWDAGMVAGKALLFVALAGTVVRYIVPMLLNQVAKTKKREAFVLSIILLCLGTATATSHFGLSMALGAFIAGLILSDSKYSHQALSEILPFREVFNCLVFVSIGMLFDVRTLIAHPGLVVVLLLLVVSVKAVIGAGVTLIAGHSARVAILTGVALAQVSEFSFVLSKLGLTVGLLDDRMNQLFLAVAILSMFFTPALLTAGEKTVRLAEKLLPEGWITGRIKEDPREKMPENHTIVVGYGVAGKSLVNTLTQLGIPYVVIENDPLIVRQEKARGIPIFYGDASRQEVLAHANITKARLLAVAISDQESGIRTVEMARRLNASLHLVARARYMVNVEPLIKVGANRVVAEEFAGSLELVSYVLNEYLMSKEAIEEKLAALRSDQGAKWQALFDSIHPNESSTNLPSDLSVELRKVIAGSPITGKPLFESGLRTKTGATVVAIQRGEGVLIPNPRADEVLLTDDVVILMGTAKQLADAAIMFAPPPLPAQRTLKLVVPSDTFTQEPPRAVTTLPDAHEGVGPSGTSGGDTKSTKTE
ncbi:MAG: cation:proton antiporter [Candidatus Melainabacteria bacterium]|nr:cation:proton antiporter [Candidatus Melainabacteria bacterium]